MLATMIQIYDSELNILANYREFGTSIKQVQDIVDECNHICVLGPGTLHLCIGDPGTIWLAVNTNTLVADRWHRVAFWVHLPSGDLHKAIHQTHIPGDAICGANIFRWVDGATQELVRWYLADSQKISIKRLHTPCIYPNREYTSYALKA